MTTLYRNGAVYSPVDPFATAMLVVDDRVAWVGAEGAAAAHADSVDEIVDLDGALVTPAFVDAHVHVTETGLARDGVDLTGAASLAEALDRVGAHARARPGEAVLGFGWEESSWPEGRAPRRAELDAATGGATVYLARRDVHSAVVSTALLDADPAIATDDGFDDGRVLRSAHHRARAVARAAVPADRLDHLRRTVLADAAALGVGSVHEIGAPHISGAEDLAAVIALGAEPGVVDVVGYWGELGGVATAIGLGARGAAGDLTIDGSLGSRTARLRSPYAGTAERGSLYIDTDAATEHVLACTEAGIQAGFHCIGDEAVDVAVAALTEAARRCGTAAVVAARHRLEHVEMLDPAHLGELARLGVVASVQPAFDELWGGATGLYAARLGADRARGLNPFAAMAREGVTLALGTDAPVTPPAGWAMVRAAAQHRVPDHRISVRGAFSAATRGGWRAARVDDAGVLAPGMLASFAVWDVPGELVVQAADERVSAWSTDPRSGVPPLPDLSPDSPLPTCLRTVVGGRLAYRAE